MSFRWRFGGVVLAMALALWLIPAVAEPIFPELTGRVVDDANLLSYPEEVAITADLKALEDKSSDQLVVVTLPSLQGYTIEDFGYQLGRRWGIGTAKWDNGVILVVAPNERKVRIEVGRGLEGTLTDALSKIIIENAILPRFRDGDFAGGIKNGVRDIALVLTGDAAEVEARAKARNDADDPMIAWIFFIVWLAIWLWILYSIYRSVRYASRSGRGQSRLHSGSRHRSGGGSGGAAAAAAAAEASQAAAAASAAAAHRVDGSAVVSQPFTQRTRPPSPRPSPAPKQKTSGEIVVVAAIASDGYRSFGVLWAALIALAVPLPLMFATKWPVQYIYLVQIVGVSALPGAVPAGRHPLRAGAARGQARPRPSTRGRAVPGAEHAHHQGPHRRADLCVVRRALRRGHRRRGHLQARCRPRPGRTWSASSPTIWPAARPPKASSAPSSAAARSSPSISRRARSITTSCLTI